MNSSKTPGTDGAKQLSDTGRPVTQAALWSLIVGDPSFPAELGLSWEAGRKVLAIGQSPNPEKTDEQKRAAKARADATRAAKAKVAEAAKEPLERSSYKSPEDEPTSLQYGYESYPKCNNETPSSDNKCDSQFDEFMNGGGAKAPSTTDDRIEAIIKFISPLMEDDEMREFGKLFEGICDPLSHAIRERTS